MILVISPAKTLNIQPQHQKYTLPQYLSEADTLISILRKFSPAEIGNLMKISANLAQENYVRYQNWDENHTLENAKIASLLFRGDVYQGLQADTFSEQDFEFAQSHLRILSGLYGVLRPLDLVHPYRLEMGTKLTHPHGKNLYEFWGQLLAENINQELDNQRDKVLVHLASYEYFKAIGTKNIRHQIITPVFKDFKNGEYKTISFYAKKARGMMASFVIKNRITKPEELKAFDTGGYQYNPKHSTENEWLFLRRQQ